MAPPALQLGRHEHDRRCSRSSTRSTRRAPTSCSSATTTSTSASRCSNAAGNADPTNGIRYITSGTGGGSHHSFGTIRPTSQARDQNTFGLLRLVLHPTSYDYEFLPVAGLGFTDSGSTSIAGNNTAPTATVQLSPGSATTGTVLTATATKNDPDADAVSLTWEWRVNGTLRRTFTSPSALSDTFDLSLAGNGDEGDSINVTVTPSDATHTGSTASSSLIVSETNAAPVFSTNLADFSVTRGRRRRPAPGGHRRRRRPLTYAASGLPDGVTIDADDRRHQRHARRGHGGRRTTSP